MSKRLLGHLTYVVVGVVSLFFAIFMASWFVRPGKTQPHPPAKAPAAKSPVTAPPGPSVQAPSAPTAPAAAPGGSPVSETPETISENVSFLEPYVFDLRDGRRNPFKVPVVSADGTAIDVMLPGTPLERYDIEELKLAGIMWDVKAPKAMIVDPQGEVHVLGKDDRVGRKRGYIAVIREGEVVVVETTTFNGESTYSTRTLRIDK